MIGKTKIIFVGNYKGGVGKTTTVLNFAHNFSKKDKKILVLDIDSQSSLSELLISNAYTSDKSLSSLEDEETLNYVFDMFCQKIEKFPSINLKFKPNIIKNYDNLFDFIPSSLFYKENLGLDEISLKMKESIDYLSILKTYIEGVIVDKNYDYILIDCPPSSNIITQSAFLMSDYYIIPTILDSVSSNGVAHYINTVKRTYIKYCEKDNDYMLYRHFFGDEPKLLGIFYNLVRGQVSYDVAKKNLENTIKNKLGMDIKIYENFVNNFIDIARSTEVGRISYVKDDFEKLSGMVLLDIK